MTNLYPLFVSFKMLNCSTMMVLHMYISINRAGRFGPFSRHHAINACPTNCAGRVNANVRILLLGVWREENMAWNKVRMAQLLGGVVALAPPAENVARAQLWLSMFSRYFLYLKFCVQGQHQLVGRESASYFSYIFCKLYGVSVSVMWGETFQRPVSLGELSSPPLPRLLTLCISLQSFQ